MAEFPGPLEKVNLFTVRFQQLPDSAFHGRPALRRVKVWGRQISHHKPEQAVQVSRIRYKSDLQTSRERVHSELQLPTANSISDANSFTEGGNIFLQALYEYVQKSPDSWGEGRLN